MKVYEIRGAFGLENLVAAERDRPAAPGPGEVLLRLTAASLNFRDLMTVQGQYNPKQPLPLIPCSDGVGVVDAVGAEVDGWAEGDRAAPIFAQNWLSGAPTRAKVRSTLGGPLDGTLAEYQTFRADGLVRPPAHLTDVEAATLACAGVTAWNALVTEGDLQAGQTVVVQGTGGVSLFALQLARLHGARVIVTSSSDDKLERARELGAWQTINYKKSPKWSKDVQEMTEGRGADLIVEVGGAGTLEQSLRSIAFGGRIALIGVLAGAQAPLNLPLIFMQRVRVQGILVGDKESFQALNRALEAAELRPVVDRIFPFDEVPHAFRHMASGEHFGKIGVEVGG